ncbi:hypothetical protein [Kineosporia sp. NBRC 101731]|uniref:hypothetical protein n=1 Tax=Kineosporia sp. NBRC 101731 TaxID=3032199 RepID=UPI0024A4C1F5|nr:hypothetical protein [Kineosporia sp. NBRC 101731]GLY33446.1 hypothetical protein Kisp02_68110 [Kineosporia sp. NBRC 101731]
MFLGLAVAVRSVDGRPGTVRFKPRRQALRVVYDAREVAWITSDRMAEYLTGYTEDQEQAHRRGNLEIVSGKGEVRFSVFRSEDSQSLEVGPHTLSEQERRDLLELAVRPSTGRPKDRARRRVRAVITGSRR